jgi:hypothetical protein
MISSSLTTHLHKASRASFKIKIELTLPVFVGHVKNNCRKMLYNIGFLVNILQMYIRHQIPYLTNNWLTIAMAPTPTPIND